MNARQLDYFYLRDIDPSVYNASEIPRWLTAELGRLPKDAAILDFGCGFGQTMRGIKALGFDNISGADVNQRAIEFARSNGFIVHDLALGFDQAPALVAQRFDVIVTTHVLEHIPKQDVVETLSRLRGLLSEGGKILVAVPNAQAYTGAYWAYEDFTHHTLYTYGSLMYVLKAAGFSKIGLLDRDASAGLGMTSRLLRKSFFRLHSVRYKFWKKVLASATHISSIDVFTYEIKMKALP